MSIIPKNIKKSFKIALLAVDTGSYTGTQFNANYAIQLRNIIQDDKDLDKVYNVTFRYKSISSTLNVGLSSENVYSLHLNFNNQAINSYSSNITRNNNVVGFLNTDTDFYKNYAAGTALPLILNANESDNAYFQINSIRNLTNINLQVLVNMTSVYVPTSNRYSETYYVCILTFTEA
jgi:hypothetical protein